MLSDSSFPVLKSRCPKPSFSLPSTPTARVVSPSVPDISTPFTIMETRPTQKSDKKSMHNNDIDIAVKSANVNCKRYIAATSENRRSSSSVSTSSAKSTNDSSSWEEAVDFEISITFNGYTYTRSRSFPRIVRLRNEIAKEISSRKKKNSNARFPVIRSLVNDATNTCITSGYYGQQKTYKPQHLTDDSTTVITNSLCDVMGLSLTMMQLALNGRSCPAIETWLQSVSSELVDPHASPSLTDFLKEDTATKTSTATTSKRRTKRRCKQPTQLWSIQEDHPCIEKGNIVCQPQKEVVVKEKQPSSLMNIESHLMTATADEDNECDAYFSAV